MTSDDAPEACMPCRGTGTVISNLGGTPKPVTCPWCRGTGVRQAAIDTQAAAASGGDDDDPGPGGGAQAPPDAA